MWMHFPQEYGYPRQLAHTCALKNVSYKAQWASVGMWLALIGHWATTSTKGEWHQKFTQCSKRQTHSKKKSYLLKIFNLIYF